jgi:hypothetical protein
MGENRPIRSPFPEKEGTTDQFNGQITLVDFELLALTQVPV